MAIYPKKMSETTNKYKVPVRIPQAKQDYYPFVTTLL